MRRDPKRRPGREEGIERPETKMGLPLSKRPQVTHIVSDGEEGRGQVPSVYVLTLSFNLTVIRVAELI